MNTVEIVFSPTGGTEKVADIIGKRWSDSPAKIDLTDPAADFGAYEFTGQELALIAMPSFGGRAPAAAIQRLGNIRGNGTRCVLACVYGNRAYEDTLAEMEDAAKASGFQVTAAISAVAQHSIMPQYAQGRPDEADRRQLTEFADRVAGKTGPVSGVPGNRPYKKAGGAGLVPKPDSSCVRCGACAKACPVGAIGPAQFTADAKRCISCMRCVKLCPQSARKVNGLMVSAAALAIKKACSVRKENQLLL